MIYNLPVPHWTSWIHCFGIHCFFVVARMNKYTVGCRWQSSWLWSCRDQLISNEVSSFFKEEIYCIESILHITADTDNEPLLVELFIIPRNVRSEDKRNPETVTLQLGRSVWRTRLKYFNRPGQSYHCGCRDVWQTFAIDWMHKIRQAVIRHLKLSYNSSLYLSLTSLSRVLYFLVNIVHWSSTWDSRLLLQCTTFTKNRALVIRLCYAFSYAAIVGGDCVLEDVGSGIH